jgi:hypothetical protein
MAAIAAEKAAAALLGGEVQGGSQSDAVKEKKMKKEK